MTAVLRSQRSIHHSATNMFSDFIAHIAQGRVALEKQSLQVAAALEGSYEVHIGGMRGGAQGWGRCLAVRVDSLADLRSQLGNALAEKSRDAGLRAVGVVAYLEVCPMGAMPHQHHMTCRSSSTLPDECRLTLSG